MILIRKKLIICILNFRNSKKCHIISPMFARFGILYCMIKEKKQSVRFHSLINSTISTFIKEICYAKLIFINVV